MTSFFIGVDVGSGSARAGVFDSQGRKAGEAKRDIGIFKPKAHFVEQSSDDIWQCVCLAVRDAVSQANIDSVQVKGIGFDATCSMVVLDKHGLPLTVSPTGRSEQNIVMWMDHRAIAQAERINDTKHPVLAFVGNHISPEMQTPKLLWLKENMPSTWAKAGYFFDLPDFLTWKATNENSRSLCSTVCKWTYLGHENRWDKDYFNTIGLGDLLHNNASSIGNDIRPMGEAIGNGLTAQAAGELGLLQGTKIATSIIDAHAGGIGVLGAAGMSGETADFNQRLALIGGTSTCHMATSKTARFINGIWGAYYSAMIPGHWLNEGGQSATGVLIDHVITGHPYYEQALEQAKSTDITVYQLLNERLYELAGSKEDIAFLTRDRHVLPYFNGNRSPRANPHLTGTMSGLTMGVKLDDMALQYLATVQAIALGTRHIIEEMNSSGYAIDTIMACGGGTKNPVFIQEHANATGCAMLLPEESEAVLLGSAMLGAVAAEFYATIPDAMSAMSRIGKMVTPTADKSKRFYDAKYRVFQQMYEDDCRYKTMMADF
ncbi:FGGY-family carbohydrate kinase [Shewanella sp. D64]|uniref:FGGY-family carbohydrate kinase n=1 Tax=unclassified Shewanella TaxID=196818 RepID=UPI0022BA1B3F|nr:MULTISPECIES: FGGY-family carbohydrate kinase [unclassified Shewanella]MEC4725570.1 FGGY-family carbohydrate kinase [Shewanella sp. D64]MEC4739622.1 FGGY-family carbohydrate kinase [Shewanella sp. E94]WBJ94911.1 FGGY-family carbohydrate kinase [Shewanella sp. MTB7]